MGRARGLPLPPPPLPTSLLLLLPSWMSPANVVSMRSAPMRVLWPPPPLPPGSEPRGEPKSPSSEADADEVLLLKLPRQAAAGTPVKEGDDPLRPPAAAPFMAVWGPLPWP